MRVVIASVQVPFVRGGAEALTEELRRALRRHGHEVEVVSMPFRFGPSAAVERAVEGWMTEDLEGGWGRAVDRVLCLKFPAYHLRHPRKVVWLLHQHRAVYELWSTGGGVDGWRLRRLIRRLDRESLGSAERLFTVSKTVAARLRFHNRLDAKPVYHPPPRWRRIYSEEPERFVLVPGRLEDHKRQILFLEAFARCRTRFVGVVVGEGGQERMLQNRAAELGIDDRVLFLGHRSDRELLALYARCQVVFFGPFEEDYGYVTLEAMLAAKPVVTCTDSGAPLEFVRDGETGYVVEPDPAVLADALDRLMSDRKLAWRLGDRARESYDGLGLSWDQTVRELLA